MREPIKCRVDLSSVINASYINRVRLDTYRAVIEDKDKAARHTKGQCRVCYYALGRLGGTMCTDAICGLCDAVMHFGNTCVDRLCLECATKHKLCRHCGSDIDDKNRRKL